MERNLLVGGNLAVVAERNMNWKELDIVVDRNPVGVEGVRIGQDIRLEVRRTLPEVDHIALDNRPAVVLDTHPAAALGNLPAAVFAGWSFDRSSTEEFRLGST